MKTKMLSTGKVQFVGERLHSIRERSTGKEGEGKIKPILTEALDGGKKELGRKEETGERRALRWPSRCIAKLMHPKVRCLEARRTLVGNYRVQHRTMSVHDRVCLYNRPFDESALMRGSKRDPKPET